MDDKHYYQTLGLDPHASADAIKKAYRQLVRLHHPDLSGAGDASRKTQTINEAYAVLGDPARRAAYDAMSRAQAYTRANGGAGAADWANAAQARAAAGAGSRAAADAEAMARAAAMRAAMHDVDSGVFNGGFFSGLYAHVGRRARTAAGAAFGVRGDDLRVTLVLTLAEACRGATRVLRLRVREPGVRGAGQLRERDLRVTIPAGVLAGQPLRLLRQGHPGSAGGAPGDLYLDIQIAPDGRFRVDGRHLHGELPITPWEAALGGDIAVPTPAGVVQVSVPPASQSGLTLRLRGRGIPGLPPGDLYLRLNVVLPPATSARARDLYRAMARDLAFNPRAGAGR